MIFENLIFEALGLWLKGVGGGERQPGWGSKPALQFSGKLWLSTSKISLNFLKHVDASYLTT